LGRSKVTFGKGNEEGLPSKDYVFTAGNSLQLKAKEVCGLREAGIKHVSLKPGWSLSHSRDDDRFFHSTCGSVQWDLSMVFRQVIHCSHKPDYPIILPSGLGRAGGDIIHAKISQYKAFFYSGSQFTRLDQDSGDGNAEDTLSLFLSGAWVKKWVRGEGCFRWILFS
jgi:hypothetical protein